MLMLGIATILQRLKAICFKVLSYVMALIQSLQLKTIGAYLITQVTQYAVRIKHLLVQTWLKIKPLRARCLNIAVLLIKAGIPFTAELLKQAGNAQALAAALASALATQKQLGSGATTIDEIKSGAKAGTVNKFVKPMIPGR